MTLAKKKSINLTEGPLFSQMILFILPVLISNLLQICYNAADMMIVGLSSEQNAVGAIGTTGSLTALIVNIFIGISTGANVVIARHLGGKNEHMVSRSVHTAIVMSVMFGTASAVAGFFCAEPLLRLMGAKDDLLSLATLYTKIYFLGVPFISVSNYTISIYRAKGDTGTPLRVLTFTGLLNVALNVFFVLACGMSVEGVALATAISNLASAAILLFLLTRDSGPCRFSFSKLCLDKKAFLEILHVGLPSGVQSALFSLSNILIQSSILQVNNTMMVVGNDYQPVINGNSAAANLESFAFTAINAVHLGTVTFTGQNAGAKKTARVWRVLWVGLVCALAVTVFFTAVILIFHRPLFALYGVEDGAIGSLEHIAFDAAFQRILYHMLPLVIYACFDAANAVARGLKKAITATVISLIGTCALRVLWILVVFGRYQNLVSIYLSYPVSWLVTAIPTFILAIVSLKKLGNGIENEPVSTSET